jgi:NADPH-dependent 2,4-dienoyl-CoA reductase/sulfur reductase-like enzyme
VAIEEVGKNTSMLLQRTPRLIDSPFGTSDICFHVMSPSIVRDCNKIQSVLVIGAGLAGLTAAIALQQAKIDVTVLEKATALYEVHRQSDNMVV